jgi:hypothetical protein
MRRIGFALLVLVVVALSACSQSQGGKAATAAGQKSAGADAAKEAVAKQPTTAPQQIVYTADLHVRVDKVGPAATRAGTIVDEAGGYVFSQDAKLSGQADTTLVFKIPPNAFTRVLDRLANLGTPLAKNINAEDVTDQVVDLQGRFETATASAARLRALLANAANVPDIVAIERELATRESEVESLGGRLRVVRSRVQFATVTVVLTSKPAPKETAGIPGFTDSLSSGWNAFANAGRVALAAIGATLPFTLLAALIAAIVLALRRRRHHPAPAQAP